ncbi:MAG: KOW domain-containing RNA-binding protein [Lachnospiraceae bacterium]|nr:KOW domain-containing RNA-binding protein [Lachnospiraceae bacterium]MBR6800410.1 KOW domain-containing RNA-binding protein [Eubacteriaceae bacterium]
MREVSKNFSGLSIGQVVRANAGREKGLFMVVCGFEGDEYVLLTDGQTRKFISPKKKKIKHVSKTNTILADVAEMIKTDAITDKRIRNALSEFNNPNKNKGVKDEQK